jgi:hypothetical protein
MSVKRMALWVLCCLCLAPVKAGARNVDFPWLSLAPEVGYVYFNGAELEKDYHAEVPSRNGVVLKGHVDLGGSRWALELAPLFTWQSAGGLVGNLNGVGGEVGLAYRISSGNLYPGFGIGFHGVYYTPNDAIQHGLDLMARFPIGMTWYFANYLGLVLEGGFMLGTTGIRFKEAEDAVRSNLSETTEYAFVLGFDLVVGLRFP